MVCLEDIQEQRQSQWRWQKMGSPEIIVVWPTPFLSFLPQPTPHFRRLMTKVLGWGNTTFRGGQWEPRTREKEHSRKNGARRTSVSSYFLLKFPARQSTYEQKSRNDDSWQTSWFCVRCLRNRLHPKSHMNFSGGAYRFASHCQSVYEVGSLEVLKEVLLCVQGRLTPSEGFRITGSLKEAQGQWRSPLLSGPVLRATARLSRR